MFRHAAKRFGLVVTASVALAACGGSTKKGIDAKDSASTSADVRAALDLPTDNNLVQKDAALDAGIARSDAALDSPLLGRDSARLDTTIIGIDSGPDNPVQKDAAADGFALDGGVDSAGVDSGYDGAMAGQDGGWVDSGGTALLTINPKNGDFGTVYPTPSPPIVFTVSNVGSESSGPFTVTISGNAVAVSYYKIRSNSCDKPLPAGENCQLDVVFIAPGGAGGPYVASLIIIADGIPGGKLTIRLSGETP